MIEQDCQLCGGETRATRVDDQLRICLYNYNTKSAKYFVVCEDCYDTDSYCIKKEK